MSNACILEVATTCNSLPGNNDCPIAFNAKIVNNDFETIKTIDLSILPDEEITEYATSFSGISRNILDNAKSFKEGMQDISRILQFLIDKNIYICGWNILELIHGTLERNLDRALSIKSNDFLSKAKVIDIQRIAYLNEDLEKLGQVTFDSVYLRMHGIQNLLSRKQCRWAGAYCKTSNAMQEDMLRRYMEELKLEKIEDVATYVGQPHLLARMPFGKYRNYEFSKLVQFDFSYLAWLRTCQDILLKNPDLKFTLDNLFGSVN